MFLSPSSRLRCLISRFAVTAEVPRRTLGNNDSEGSFDDEYSLAAQCSNAALGDVLTFLSTLGTHYVKPSDWSRLKQSLMGQVRSMPALMAVRCLCVFGHHRVCGKTEAMRLQEQAASMYESLPKGDVVSLLHTLATLGIDLSSSIKPCVLSSLTETIRTCHRSQLSRLLFALSCLLESNDLSQEIVSIAVEATSKVLHARHSLKRSEQVYLLWSCVRLLSKNGATLDDWRPLYNLVRQSLSLDGALVSIPNPISLDVVHGKTPANDQLQPRDTVLLMYILCAIESLRGGAGCLGRHFYDNRAKQSINQQQALVDDGLLEAVDQQHVWLKTAAFKPHADALASRVTVSLLSCEVSSMDVVCRLLSNITLSGLIYCSTAFQLLSHLLLRCLLFQFRDAVFFDDRASVLISSSPQVKEATDDFTSLTILRDTPGFSEAERVRLTQLRLTTSVSQCQGYVRSRIRSEELTIVLNAIGGAQDIFDHCILSNGATSTTFFEFYASIASTKLPRAIRSADAQGLTNLVIAACNARVMTAATLEIAVKRLTALNSAHTDLRRHCCNIMLRYANEFAKQLWKTPQPPPAVCSALKVLIDNDGLDTCELMASICEAARSRNASQAESLLLALRRRVGASAPGSSDCRTVILFMGQHAEGLFMQHNDGVHHVLIGLLDRACQEANVDDSMKSVFACWSLGTPAYLLEPFIHQLTEDIFSRVVVGDEGSLHAPQVMMWMRLVQSCGLKIGLEDIPPVVLLPVRQMLRDEASSTTMPKLKALRMASLMFYFGDDHVPSWDVILAAATNEAHLSVQPSEKVIAATMEAILSSWRGSDEVVEKLLLNTQTCDIVLKAVRQRVAVDTESDRRQALERLCAAATLVVRGSVATADLSSEIHLYAQELFCDTSGFSIVKTTAWVNSSPVRCVLHPCAMTAIVSQALQAAQCADNQKLLGAHLWRQCVKHCEKIAIGFQPSARDEVSVNESAVSAFTGHRKRASLSAIRSEDWREGSVLVSLVAIMLRLGATSQSMDTLLLKWKKHSAREVDFVALGMMADGILRSGKRRAGVTDFIGHYVQSNVDIIGHTPAFGLAQLLMLTQREAERVSLGHTRAELVRTVLWAALHEKARWLPPEMLVSILPTATSPESTITCCVTLAEKLSSLSVERLVPVVNWVLRSQPDEASEHRKMLREKLQAELGRRNSTTIGSQMLTTLQSEA